MFRRSAILFGALGVLYAAVRLWRLDASCLWFDEIFSVHAAEHDWSSLFWFVAQDLIHPPLFYLLLKFWIAIGGETVYWLRLLPVLFSVLAIFPFVRLCKELKFSNAVTLLALFLLAVNGALIKYTQTVRMYSMLMFLALLSFWLFARFFNRGKSFVPLVIVNVLLIYTHYFGWLIVGTELAALLFFQRIKWRRAVVMTGILVASFVPWLIAVFRAEASGSDIAQNIAWQTRPGIRELIVFATDLVEPFYFQASNAEPASIYVVTTPLLLVVITMMGLYVVEWKREENRRSIYLLLFFAELPFLVAFIVSWVLPHSVWGTRHLVFIFPAVMILVANAVVSFPVRTVSIIAVGFIVVLSAIGLVRHAGREIPLHVWCAWSDVANDIRARSDQPAMIYTFENLVAYHTWFALRDSDRYRVGVVKGVDVRTDDEAYFLPRGFDAVQRTSIDDISDDRLWLVFRAVPGEERRLIEEFGKRGYLECQNYHVGYGPVAVIWAEMKRSCR